MLKTSAILDGKGHVLNGVAATRSYRPGLYVLLKPLRALVTVKEPSCCADNLIQYAVPLWTGAGGAPGPGRGAGVGAMGIPGCGSSIVLAINIPGTVYSCPLRREK